MFGLNCSELKKPGEEAKPLQEPNHIQLFTEIKPWTTMTWMNEWMRAYTDIWGTRCCSSCVHIVWQVHRFPLVVIKNLLLALVDVNARLIHHKASTLHSLQLVCLYDNTELQHQLWSALQEGGQQMQHAHICKLIHHPPVVTPALRLRTLTALNAQIDGVNIPGREIERKNNQIKRKCTAMMTFWVVFEDLLLYGFWDKFVLWVKGQS